MHIDQEINAQKLRSQKKYKTTTTGFRCAIEGDLIWIKISLVSNFSPCLYLTFFNVGVCHPGKMFTNKADALKVDEHGIMSNIERIRTL